MDALPVWEAVTALHFLRPWWFVALLPLLFILWRLRRRERRNDWQPYIDPALLEAMLHREHDTRWLTPRRLAGATFLLAIIALAGPSWRDQPSPFGDNTAPLVIVLSLGSNMLERDLIPTRLQQAKLKIDALLQQRRAAPTALMVYAGSTHTVLPLTEDVDLLSFYLQELSPEVMPIPGNRPDLALKEAATLLRDYRATNPGPAGSILLVAADLGSTPSPQDLPDSDVLSLHWLYTATTDNRNQRELARSYGLQFEPISADQSDVQQLHKAVQRQWQRQSSWEHPVRKDDGYALLWPLSLMMALFFRRGMVLRW